MFSCREICVAGEKVIALPEKALFWPSESALFIADIHLGKEASFLAAGVPVPLGPTSETLANLSTVLTKAKPKILYLLGDLWHAKAGRTIGFTDDFIQWRKSHHNVEMVLVEGNHDLKSGPLPIEANVREVKEPYTVGPFSLCHYPETVAASYVLSGHLHPGVVLQGRGRQALKLPCFWFGPQTGVLPAFGEFTGCSKVSPAVGDQVLIVAEGQVMPVQIS